MVTRDELTHTVHQLIGEELVAKANMIDDAGANGVQFHGAQEVRKVALGVSLNSDFLREALVAGAQYCIFHHGFDPRTVGYRYGHSAQERLALIIKNDLTIAGYHFALDAQPEFGNSATIARLLGATRVDTLDDEWGCVAELPKPIEIDKLSSQCAEIFSHDIIAVKSGPSNVQRVGIVTGAGKPYQVIIEELISKGVELYISGESSESRLHAMQEEGINYFLAGHYATEVFGVQELGKKLKAHYKDKLEVEFIDIPNPL
jgi:dinuclear metal center YbgI/SA1388 family protein